MSLTIWQAVVRELRSVLSAETALGNNQRPLTRSTARTGPVLTSSIFGGSSGSLTRTSCAGGQ